MLCNKYFFQEQQKYIAYLPYCKYVKFSPTLPFHFVALNVSFSGVHFSHSVVSDSLALNGTEACQASLSITNSRAYSNSCPSSRWCHPLPLPSPPIFNLFQHQGLSQWVSSSHHMAKVLEFQLQQQSFQWIFRTDFSYDRLVGSPCCPRDCQESSPTPQFKSINSLALSLLYSPTLISVNDYGKNHSFD